MTIRITNLQPVVQEWIHNGIQKPESGLVGILSGREVFSDQFGYGCGS